jgi:hypothetical protein
MDRLVSLVAEHPSLRAAVTGGTPRFPSVTPATASRSSSGR